MLAIITSIVLFFALLPLSNKVTFMQNDDWYYYQAVGEFLKGNFDLHPDIAPTFYVQGFLGAFFSNFFTSSKLPILTLIISVLCFYVFYLILKENFSFSKKFAILSSLVLFLSPIFSYSIWGFMTEQYFLLFFLLSWLYFLRYLKNKKLLNFLLIYLFTLLAFFTRQVGMALPLSFSIYLFIKKDYKKAIEQLLFFGLIYSFYSYIFPKTLEMNAKSLQFQHFIQSNYLFSFIIGSLIYLVSLSIPFVLIFIKSQCKELNWKKKFIFVLFSILIFFLIKEYFQPNLLAWAEYPYFANTWERKGLYPRSIHGTKYHFIGIHDLYFYWDLLSKILLSICLSLVLVTKSLRGKIFNQYNIFIVIYLGMSFLTVTFFDRYLLVVLPLFYLSLLRMSNFSFNLFVQKLSVIGFVVFFGILFYQFSVDFVLTEKYVWEKGEDLVSQGILEKEIYVSSAWNEMYSRNREVSYIFSYDSPNVNPDLKVNFDLIEENKIDYWGNLHLNSKVFLYKKNTTPEVTPGL